MNRSEKDLIISLLGDVNCEISDLIRKVSNVYEYINNIKTDDNENEDKA